MNTKKLLSKKTAGLCGILAPIIGLTCIGLAVLLCPWFSWTENYLSDLGGFPGDRPIWTAHGTASILFNVGLFASGVLGICFGLGLRKSREFSDSLGNIGISFLIFDAAALMGIGIFPETTGPPHTFFSFAFFILVGISLALVGIALIKTSERTLGWFTIALFIFGLISVPLFIIPQPVGSNAIAEMIPITSVSIFSVVFGYKLLFSGIKEESENESDEKKNE